MAKVGFHYGGEDDLKQALTELRGHLNFVLLERIDAIAFDCCNFDDATNEFHLSDSSIADTELANWEEGRAFGETVELRWRKIENGQYHFCCLAADDNLPPQINANNVLSLNGWERRPFSFLLWGVKTVGSSDEWIEQRIPRVLCYPVGIDDQRPRVVVEGEEYVCRDLEKEAHGEAYVHNVEERFVRFKRLCEVPEGGQS
ncbi:MAG TPA: hypothetical protein ENI60_02495 [Candidatus Fraserbacteria bacterium]|nr:hypothetical protein [Candidatus Fraserbacteria bacterium]